MRLGNDETPPVRAFFPSTSFLPYFTKASITAAISPELPERTLYEEDARILVY
jgi:hypothetical protein